MTSVEVRHEPGRVFVSIQLAPGKPLVIALPPTNAVSVARRIVEAAFAAGGEELRDQPRSAA